MRFERKMEMIKLTFNALLIGLQRSGEKERGEKKHTQFRSGGNVVIVFRR